MPGVGRVVLASTPLLCRCLDPQSGPPSLRSLSFVSAYPVHLIRLQRKWPQLLPPELSHGLHSGTSPRFLSLRANLSRSLSRERCADEESVEGTPFSSSIVLPKQPGGFALKAMEDAFSLCLTQSGLTKNLGVLVAGSFDFGAAGTALAEIIDVPTPDEGAQPTDYLLTVLFISAFIGLAVLTIGVIYLSVSDFLENRQRKAMQKTAAEEKSEESEKIETLRAGNPKGFGVPKVEKKSEKGK